MIWPVPLVKNTRATELCGGLCRSSFTVHVVSLLFQFQNFRLLCSVAVFGASVHFQFLIMA